ncbi:Molybdenum-pterin-binding protein MopA [Acinetobacter calcoaceticus]|uniref:winged helix-turn-helix domain-containing protein n=1 Tax=Acinetobacter TaxID=469 RepID=UPI0021CD65C7|nr:MULTISPECIES: LysR family transcriptional regulator [unclassified Acinetobacter]MCU4423262.1 LysR family transcriptional regulator [Acinetobacter sp. WU_MDCI_Abxb74]MEB3862981.1 LysR family transcriptional regulator [Acinetobacter sp. IK31]CAI3108841.1 Molybdenum-pterin-binding protein MopA [Acinetobacter calcoaceticus]
MKEHKLKLQIRILSERNIAFGPGKADLLEAIERTGSISQAAKSMNMSYRRAWQLVDTMNQCFETALVETQTGGTHGGGAAVTALGQKVLEQYRQMEINARQALEHDYQIMSSYLKKID